MPQDGIKHYDRPPSYSTFLDNHLKPLVPCIIDGLLVDWQSMSDWRCRSTSYDGKEEYLPNYEYLKSNFGSHQVSVTKSASIKEKMPFSQFLDLMASNEQVYARDIHLMAHYPDHKIYQTPTLFQDDYLNFQLISQDKDDYRFVYIGSDGTETKLHKDVVASHSWSSNITGTKRWTLIPPAVTHHLFTFDHEEVVETIYNDDPVTRARWPSLEKVRDVMIEVIQRPGETIFVPSTWYHQVTNIGATLSINHNWINAVSLLSIFDNLVVEMEMSSDAVIDLKEDAIVDDKGFAEVVQDLTLANAGMNWSTFFELILFRLENETSYIDASYRPGTDYENGIIKHVCVQWQALEASKYLPSVGATVKQILLTLQHSHS